MRMRWVNRSPKTTWTQRRFSNQSARSILERLVAMAETEKLSENEAPPSEPTKMSSYRHCMDVVLKLLSDFGKEVGLVI